MTDIEIPKKKYVYKKVKSFEKQKLASYELVIMLRHDVLNQEALDLCENIEKILTNEKYKCNLIKVEYWGLRNLAYKIKKSKKSHFYCFSYTTDNVDVNKELIRVFGINDQILRHLILRIQSIPEGPSLMQQNIGKDMAAEMPRVASYDERYIYQIKKVS